MRRYLSTRPPTSQRRSHGKRSPLLLDVSSADSYPLLNSAVVDVPPFSPLSNDDRPFYLQLFISASYLRINSSQSLPRRSHPSHLFSLQIHLHATQPSRSHQHFRLSQPYHLSSSRIPQERYLSTSIDPLHQLLRGSATSLPPLSNQLQHFHRLAQLERMAQPASHGLKRRSC